MQRDLIDQLCPSCVNKLELDGDGVCVKCGWKPKTEAEKVLAQHIPCDGLPDCMNSATIRIGNANVCKRCYPTEAPRLRMTTPPNYLNNPAVRACREAFERSRYKRAQAPTTRQPGED